MDVENKALLEKGYSCLELKKWKLAKENFENLILSGEHKSQAYIGLLLAELKLCNVNDLKNVKNLGEYDYFENSIRYANDEQLKNLEEILEISKSNTKKKTKKKHKIITTIFSIFVFLVAILIVTVFVIVPNYRLNLYKNLLNNGNLESAIYEWKHSSGFEYKEKNRTVFKDYSNECIEKGDYISAEIIYEALGIYDSEVYLKATLAKLKDAEIHNSVKIDILSDSSAREWTVLAKEGNRVLIISEHYFDNYKGMVGGWKDSSNREYLNKDFYRSGLKEEFKSRVLDTKLVTNTNNKNITTVDKVFILSKDEVVKYCPNIEKRKAGVLRNSNGDSFCVINKYGEIEIVNMNYNESKGQEESYSEYIEKITILSYYYPAMWIDVG